jgi:hypothetical protein
VDVFLTREDCNYVAILRPIIALHDQLMSSGHEREAIVVVEGLGNVLPKGVACTSGGYTPPAAVIRVGPQQIAHGALMRHFLDAVQGSNIIKGVYTGGQSSVKTKDLVINQGGEGKEIKEVCKEPTQRSAQVCNRRGASASHTSKHLRFRICASTRRRSRRPG